MILIPQVFKEFSESDYDFEGTKCDLDVYNPPNDRWQNVNSMQVDSKGKEQFFQAAELDKTQLKEIQKENIIQDRIILLLVFAVIFWYIIEKVFKIQLFKLNFAQQNGSKQYLAHYLILAANVFISVGLLSTFVLEIISGVSYNRQQSAVRCKQFQVIDELRDLYKVNDWNNHNAASFQKQNMATLSDSNISDILLINTSADLWTLPFGQVRNNIKLSDVNSIAFSKAEKNYQSLEYPQVRHTVERLKMDRSDNEIEEINTRLCQFLANANMEANINLIHENKFKKIPIVYKNILDKHHYDQANSNDSILYKNMQDIEYERTLREGATPNHMEILLNKHTPKTIALENLTDDCIQRFAVERTRAHYFQHTVATKKDLRTILGPGHEEIVEEITTQGNLNLNKSINSSTFFSLNVSLHTSRMIILCVVQLLILTNLVLSNMQLSELDMNGLDRLKLMSLVTLVFAIMLTSQNNASLNLAEDLCFDLHFVDAEFAQLPKSTGIGNWFKSTNVRDLSSNEKTNQATYNIMSLLNKNQEQLLAEQKEAATVMLNGGFIWKQSFTFVEHLQTAVDYKQVKEYARWNDEQFTMYNKMLFLYSNLKFQHKEMHTFNELIYGTSQKEVVHMGLQQVCHVSNAQLQWTSWIQFLIITMGALLLFMSQTFAIGFIKWYKGQSISHCRQKASGGQSMTDIDNKTVANPSTLRFLNDK